MRDELYVARNEVVARKREERTLDRLCGGRVLERKSACLGRVGDVLGAGERRPSGCLHRSWCGTSYLLGNRLEAWVY